MTSKDKNEFNEYISDIVLNKKFNLLNKDLHHGITRYEHSMRVAKYSYIIAKKLKLKNIKSITRASLLHDFYINKDLENLNSREQLKSHPYMAYKNAIEYYDINELEKDIIIHHMFPVTHELPKSKESFLVSMVDKLVATYEMIRFKAPLYAATYYIFMFQLILRGL